MTTAMSAWPRSFSTKGKFDTSAPYDQKGDKRSIRSSYAGREDLFTNSKYKILPSRDSHALVGGYGFGPPNAPVFGSANASPANATANIASLGDFGPTTQRMSPSSSIPIPINNIPSPMDSSRSATTQSFRRGATPTTKSNGTFAFLAIVGLVVGGAAFAIMGYVKPEATHRSAQATTQIAASTSITTSSTPIITSAASIDDAPIGATPPVMVISAPDSPIGAIDKKIAVKAPSTVRRAVTPQKPVAKSAAVPALPTNPYESSSASGG